MSTGEYRFRSSAFGFNRQDVIHYIEAIHRDYAAQLQSVKKDLEWERGQRTQVEEQGSLASEEAAAAGKDAQRCKEELARVLEELQEAQRQREELRLRLQATQKDFADLQAAAEQMAPAARAYEALKEKAASIELDAHERAQAIVKEGKEEAAETRQKVTDWLNLVESSYARLRADAAATLSHATAELERTARSLDSVTAELDAHGQRLDQIAEGEESAAVSGQTQQPQSPHPFAPWPGQSQK